MRKWIADNGGVKAQHSKYVPKDVTFTDVEVCTRDEFIADMMENGASRTVARSLSQELSKVAKFKPGLRPPCVLPSFVLRFISSLLHASLDCQDCNALNISLTIVC